MSRRVRAYRFALLSLVQIAFATALPSVSNAALVTATGTNASACNQVASNSAGVTATRSGQDCIVTFTNTSEVLWSTPIGITSVQAIIVGGGGGGGDSAASSTGGGGGAGGYFATSNLRVSGDIAIAVGDGGAGSALTTQGANGGTSYLGTLKVGGGGGGNGNTYAGGARARAGVGGSDFVSSGGGGGGRPTGSAAYTNEHLGGLAGQYASSGIAFLGNTYIGTQGVAGSQYSDGASGGFGGVITPSSLRTSTISGSSVEYSKVSQYVTWESSGAVKTPGSGGSPNYGYGVDPTVGGGAGAAGVIILRYTLSSAILAPTFSGTIYKGTLESVTVTVNIPGKVRFFIDGKRISGCLAVNTTGSTPNISATCTWKPSVHGMRSIHAVLTPSDGTTASAISPLISLPVLKRPSNR